MNTKSEVPPGIRMDLEMGNKRLRELGVTQEAVDRMLMEIELGPEYLAIGFLKQSILAAHKKDRWRDRRRLKKTLSLVHDGSIQDHLRDCVLCRIAVDTICDRFVQYTAAWLKKTAPA